MQSVDGRPLRGPVRVPVDVSSEGSSEVDSDEDEEPFEENPRLDARQAAYDAYGRVDFIHRSVSEEMQMEQPRLEQNGVGAENDVDFDNLMQECMEPVFEYSGETRMQFCIVLMTLSTIYGVSDSFVTALLTYMAGTLLPRGNCLPRNSYEMKTMILRLGLEHERIDSCPNGHVLYEGDTNGNLQECPRCQHPRYVPGSQKVPFAVTRYFPIIPKMERLYKCPQVAELLDHFGDDEPAGNVMHSVADSFQWREVNRMYPELKKLSENLRLGLIADGVCPHGNQSSKHSTWIVLIAIYNFPPWLATKKFFLNLSLLIPGPRAPTSDTIDVYLRPLVRDLLHLWEGVPAVNMSRPPGQRDFTLRAILLWTVHDFPAFGLIAGQTVKGYVGCPVCGGDTVAEYSKSLRKMLYLGARRFLPPGHRFRRARAAFNNCPEHGTFPARRTGEQILQEGRERSEWLRNGGVEDSEGDPVKRHGVKRASVLFALPYWQVNRPCFLYFVSNYFLLNLVSNCMISCVRVAAVAVTSSYSFCFPTLVFEICTTRKFMRYPVSLRNASSVHIPLQSGK